MSKEKAKATDAATAELANATPYDPTADHHLGRLQAEAKRTKKPQRFVIASGKMDEGIGERVLIVQPNGSHSIVFEETKK